MSTEPRTRVVAHRIVISTIAGAVESFWCPSPPELTDLFTG